MASAAPTQTIICVRMPADQSFRSRSNPIIAPRTAASPNRSKISCHEIMSFYFSNLLIDNSAILVLRNY
jgi:hypothetical protein